MRLISLWVALFILIMGWPHLLLAQHPIDIQRYVANGEYFEALLSFDKMSKRKVTTDARIAAAKAAWALGLSDRAIEEYEYVLRSDNLDQETEARIILSRGIIEFQEEEYEVAMLFAEKAINIMSMASPLRAKAWLLWGESLYVRGSYGAAEQKYLKALEESLPEESYDIHYRLGVCQMKLAKLHEAKQNFEMIPYGHERTPESIRYLAKIALDNDKFDEAEFWLSKGRIEYPEDYLDSWVDYAFLNIAISNGEDKLVREIQKKAIVKYPPSDNWLTLLNAAAEAYLWKKANNRRKNATS